MAEEIAEMLSAVGVAEPPLASGDRRNISTQQEPIAHESCLPATPDADVGDMGEGNRLAPVQKLPIEILEYIFSYLDVRQRIRCESVCRQWRWVDTVLPWTWPRTLTLEAKSSKSNLAATLSGGDSYHLSDGVVQSILSRCGSGLKRLTLRRNKFALWGATCALQTVAQNCPNLVHLTLLNVPLKVEDLRAVGRNCARLKILRLHRYDEISEAELSALVGGLLALETLEVGSSTNDIVGECFSFLNPNLKVLRLFCSQKTLEPIRYEKLINRCNRLQELNLRINTRLYKVDKPALMNVMLHFKNTLKTLALESTPWCEVVLVVPNLEKLNLTGCRHVNVDFCRQLTGKCVKLRVLDVSSTDLTDEGMCCLASCPRLVILDISYTNILGSGVEVVAKQGRLQMLFARDLLQVLAGDLHFGALPKFCPNFRLLDVCNTPTITNELVLSFLAAFKDGCLKKPVKLHVTGTSITTDVSTCSLLQINYGLDDEGDTYNDEDGIEELFRMYEPFELRSMSN